MKGQDIGPILKKRNSIPSGTDGKGDGKGDRRKRGQIYFSYSNSGSWQRRELAVM